MEYEILLILHVIGACVLLGTGAGIAFFMFISNRSGAPALIAHTAGIVVIADTAFTATAAVAQPITGLLLAREVGWPVLEGWVLASLGLYVFVGIFWLPVVWMQRRMRDLAIVARDAGDPLPAAYHRIYRVWFRVPGVLRCSRHHVADADETGVLIEAPKISQRQQLFCQFFSLTVIKLGKDRLNIHRHERRFFPSASFLRLCK